MKSVLIVGAGPAGLVTAKTLLQSAPGKFTVTVFESAERVGGMWRARRGEEGAKCSPDMRTNLSRFTVAFSDLSWNSVNLTDAQDGQQSSAPPPMFPYAWQVGRYLQEYARKFIPNAIINCNRAVTKAELVAGTRRWSVSSIDKTSQKTRNDEFDYLLVASGFYDRPEIPAAYSASTSTAATKVLHSSEFRDVSSLTNKPGNIVVIGGGISGSEAAATAAFQISDAKYAPGQPKPAWSECKVYHVLNRPFYCLPRYLPQDPYEPSVQNFKLAPKFLPIDIVLYNLSRRGEGPISAPLGRVPPENARKGHSYLRSIVGGDQRDVGYPELVHKPEEMQFPAFNGITDTYTEFARSGLIVPVRGRGTIVQDGGRSGTARVEVRSEEPWGVSDQRESKIDNVVGIIEATGFQANLDYLPESIKEALGYDAKCRQVPTLFSRGSVFNPSIPEMAFVGFYQGPYWGFMEMQARMVTSRWSGITHGEEGSGSSITDVQEMEDIRKMIKSRINNIQQFWMGDYMGFMEEFSRMLGIQRNDSVFGRQEGPCFAARYATEGGEAGNIIQELQIVLDDSEKNARFVAVAAFRGMQGNWTLRRKIDSKSPAAPGGTLKGTAAFHPRIPSSPEFAAEYLYIEQGTFTTDNGYSFPATRRYVYRYNEASDKITAWFVKEDGESVERFFNQMEFQESTDSGKGWIANGSHWCDPDTYKSSSEFRFRGAALDCFGITYDVSGPKKDFTMESWYQRPLPRSLA
ncbi:uncharacterized protein BDR25DRAFT_272942 [Lindgomyces ingoldianus]|uniref:Uncharacterized protein n=1 Tax=Lindgomyces ingoldianus TaxID=673940 RepID=A0ACB6QBM3_9PLEO|nr:uncharacterized protein BDR25DRAFT_272942 [Lindgomyces ingoldianus]KAF2463507.1 hypothetical protein BDR25DRAFT_272942 [Lindgomyces ingoldianus]